MASKRMDYYDRDLQARPHYVRWASIAKRQKLAKKHARPSSVSQFGFEFCWCAPRLTGYRAFEAWVEAQLATHPEIPRDAFYIKRHDETKRFGPDNCYLSGTLLKHRPSGVLDDVAEIPPSPAATVRRYTGWLGERFQHHRPGVAVASVPPEQTPLTTLETLFHLR